MSILKDFFDDLAVTYDNQKYVTSRDVTKEASMLYEYLDIHNSSRMLDIGCGTGRLSYEFYKKGYDIHSIDISPEMIRKSIDKYPQMKDRFECVDFQDLDNGYYDRVFSIMGGAFGLIPTNEDSAVVIDSFFTKLNQILNNSGIAIIEFLNIVPVLKEVSSDNIKNKEFLPEDNLVQYSEYIYEKGFTSSEIECICEKFGFKATGIYSVNRSEYKLEELSPDSHVGILVLTKN